ncbi:transglutaminase-like domain-containing protein [Microbacterium karelineae]|uniref:transglutaminase-like domain-containing protein n=1 Tax=Microbacterium karelineae TaxID=2654283 RepID=UPI001E57C7A3|nr:transglutaminase-like domain-containing protein [Microbacterium karelineae]
MTSTGERTAPPREVVDVAAVALLLAVPAIGFVPTFAGMLVLASGLAAVAIGLGIACLAARSGWGVLPVAAAVCVAYFVLGGPLAVPATTIAGVVPTLDTVRELATGVVTSWKTLLTTVPPVSPQDGHLIVPFLLLLVSSVVTGTLALRLASPAWAIGAAAATLAGQIALGTSQPAAPVVQGVLWSLVSIVWLVVRHEWRRGDEIVATTADGEPRSGRGHATRRALVGAGVLALAAVIGGGAILLAPAGGIRYVVRDVIIPPFDVREFASPLQDFRIYVDAYDDVDLFTVSGLPAGARVRLAAMDAFSGAVYDVTESTSAFLPLRTGMSDAAPDAPRSDVRIEIGAYDDVWLPTVGEADAIAFDGDGADELRRATFYNASTGTAVVRTGLHEGDAYTVRAVVPGGPDEAVLVEDEFADVDVPEPTSVPAGAGELAADAIAAAGAQTPYERVEAITTFLAESGYFSHGLDEEQFSPSGHGSARLSTMVDADEMVGDDEQYATLMALMAYESGIPARVVMGFHDADDDGELVANGSTLHAWVEVAFAESGWVAFDPTPDEDNEPKDQSTKPKADPQPMPLQPPPPPKESADEPPLVPDDRQVEEDDEPESTSYLVYVVAGGISLGTILLLLSPFLIIGAFKATRRRRRRAAEAAADRISGGWDELADRAVDFGHGVAAGTTRSEQSWALAGALEDGRVGALATRADAGVFAPGDPAPEEVDGYWDDVDGVVADLRRRSSFWRRMRARLSLASFRRNRTGSRVRAFREAVAVRRERSRIR